MISFIFIPTFYMSCCSMGTCKGCNAMKVVTWALLGLFEIAALIGIWSTHMRSGIFSGSNEASLALLVAIIGLMLWSKACTKMCPCTKMSSCGMQCDKCPGCGTMPCVCKKK